MKVSMGSWLPYRNLTLSPKKAGMPEHGTPVTRVVEYQEKPKPFWYDVERAGGALKLGPKILMRDSKG